jgi:5'-methylthioinosine phosphorylase
MSKIGIIGGTGLSVLSNLLLTHSTVVKTPFGEPSAPLKYGSLANSEVVFLSRGGADNSLAPQKINYPANIWALRDAGVDLIIATTAVGAIDETPLGKLVIPAQVIDYTYGRSHTFFEKMENVDKYVNFAEPYDEHLRAQIAAIAQKSGIPFILGGTIGVVQGPRLETKAEVKRYKQDGCDYIGMTVMPEAALARELNIPYVNVAITHRRAGEPLAASGQDGNNMESVEINPNLAKLLDIIIQEL